VKLDTLFLSFGNFALVSGHLVALFQANHMHVAVSGET
jgi:hypothetical protein